LLNARGAFENKVSQRLGPIKRKDEILRADRVGRGRSKFLFFHSEWREMSSIDGAIGSVLAAKDSALQTQIGFAIAGKQLDAQQQQGDAVNQLLESAAKLSKSIGTGSSFDGVG
jgi:hypothetical protein